MKLIFIQLLQMLEQPSVVFIFLRWSPHFASFYTPQFLPNQTSTATAAYFPILHMLPIDLASTSSFDSIVSNYNQIILSNITNTDFSDDVRIKRIQINLVIFFLSFFR